MARTEESIRKLFEEWDSDGSGTIDREELSSVMKKLCGLQDDDIGALIDEADSNKDGVIDYAEFLDWLLKPAAKSTGVALCDYASVLKPLFECYDRDSSGNISVDEFVECHSIMQGSLQLFPGDEEQGADIKLYEVNKDSEHVFQQVDKSGDGQVSFGEFVAWQQKLFEKQNLSKEEVQSFIKNMTTMLRGIFDIQEQCDAGYADDKCEEALKDYIEGLSKGIREWCKKDGGTVSKGGGSSWTEPPVGLNAETLKRTFTKMYPMKMRNVKSVEITVMCVPMPDEGDPEARGWAGEVSRRVQFEPDLDGNEKHIAHKPAHFQYDQESFSWKPLKGEDGKQFIEACEALAPEMKLFCVLKTQANFGVELKWKDIVNSLTGAVDMGLLTEGHMNQYRQFMITEAITKGKADGFSDANEDYALGALDAHLVLRPRQIMATLTELGIVQVSEVWQDFVQSD